MKKNANRKALRRRQRKAKIRKYVRNANIAKEARETMDSSFVANRAKLAKTASTLTQMIKNVAKNKSNKSTVKQFKQSLNKFDQKSMGKGASGVASFAYKKGEPYLRNKHLAKRISKDSITIMAAAASGFKTGFYNNGSRKPIFKKKKVDKNGNDLGWESDDEAKKHQKEYKKEYTKWRRRIKNHPDMFYAVLDKYKEVYGDSAGDVDASDQVINNIAEYIGTHTIDPNDKNSLENAVHDIWDKLSGNVGRKHK